MTIENKPKTQLEVGREYEILRHNPMSSTRGVEAFSRTARFSGRGIFEGGEQYFFSEEKEEERNYLYTHNIRVMPGGELWPRVPKFFKLINKNKIQSLPERERSELVKVLNQLGEQI